MVKKHVGCWVYIYSNLDGLAHLDIAVSVQEEWIVVINKIKTG